MDIYNVLSQLTKDNIARLTYAVEVGFFPEGKHLSQEQRDYAMQLIMLYQSKYNINAQHMSVDIGGKLKVKTKAEFKQEWTKDLQIKIQKEED